MNRPFLALLAALFLSPILHAEVTPPLPSFVQDAGWPEGAKGVVRDLKPVRLTSSLETEQAILIDGDLYLAFRPGRYSEFVELATGVESIQVVPNGDGTESLVLIRSGGAVALHWDWNVMDYVVMQPLPGDLDSWGDVQKMWIQESAGVQYLYGHDRGAGKILRARHCSGVWTSEPALACHGALRDMAFVELDATSPGEEIVQLEKYAMYILSADGSLLLDKMPAKATDSIAVLRSPDVASSDLFVHSYVESGSHFVRVQNGTQSSPGFPLGSSDCSAILPRQGPTYGDHLLLTRGGSGDVDVLEIHTSTGPGGLILERNADGLCIDTHEDTDQRPVQAASLVDIDLDGREDLMVAVLNGNSLELRNVMTSQLSGQRWQNLEQHVPVLTQLGSSDFELRVKMQVPDDLASSIVQVEMWARQAIGTPEESVQLLGRQWVTLEAGATQVEFTQAFSKEGWAPLAAHYEMSFTPVELDSSGAVTRIFPSQSLAWAGPNAPCPVENIELGWLNFDLQNAGSQRTRSRRASSPTQRPVSGRIGQ